MLNNNKNSNRNLSFVFHIVYKTENLQVLLVYN